MISFTEGKIDSTILYSILLNRTNLPMINFNYLKKFPNRPMYDAYSVNLNLRDKESVIIALNKVMKEEFFAGFCIDYEKDPIFVRYLRDKKLKML
jgi:hypothetical protein